MKEWSADDDATIQRLISQGRTRRQIAVHFGVTRNAICGRVHRLTSEVDPAATDQELIASAPECLAPDPLRVPPDRVPFDDVQFAGWIRFACVEWPTALMSEGSRAHESLRRGDDSKLREFLKNYAGWWGMTEEQKISAMHQIQRDSPRRLEYLERARGAARYTPHSL